MKSAIGRSDSTATNKLAVNREKWKSPSDCIKFLKNVQMGYKLKENSIKCLIKVFDQHKPPAKAAVILGIGPPNLWNSNRVT